MQPMVLRLIGLGVAVIALWGCSSTGDGTTRPSRVSSTILDNDLDPIVDRRWRRRQDSSMAVPPEIIRPPWLGDRADAQRSDAANQRVFNDFGFVDRIQESGIRFRNVVVADAAKTYKSVHYDHGTGLAVADVDGDGWLDLYFVNQVGANELWRNLGSGRFENVTDEAGVAVADRIGVTASFADVDNDGDPDLYVTTVRQGNVLFENLGDGTFNDVTSEAGLDYSGHSSGAVFFDFDRDGLLDLFLTNVGQYTVDTVRREGGRYGEPAYEFYDGREDAFSGHLYPERSEPSRLYKNMGDMRFADVTQAVGLVDISWTGDASPVDVNSDGWPDLYVLNMQGDDHYWENVGGRRFERKSREVFPKTPWGSMGVKVFDFDNDGAQDIFVTDMHSDMIKNQGPDTEKEKIRPDAVKESSIYGNAFYLARGDGSFDEVSDQNGAENYWPWGLSVGDLNADGFDDAFIASSMNYPYRYGINSVLLNDQGEKFIDSEFTLGVEPRRDGLTAMPWFSLQCNRRDQFDDRCQDRSDRLDVWGAVGSRSSAIFDLDNDGDLDVVTNDFNYYPMVLVSDLSERLPELKYLKISLAGSKSNRDGLGATVRVTTNVRTYAKVVDGKSGYLSQSSIPLYFGFGADETITSIAVDWPSGFVQTLEPPANLNALVVIREP
jgi:hypothetical protein